LKKVAKAAEDGGITLSFDVADNLPPLFADARSVTQIVLNLLSNATKFTKPGGTVSLSAGSRGGQIVISVKDTGIGIPPDKLKVITEPFSQASSNPHNAQEGTGLGLSIVASLVEAHDGELRIESDIGTGTAVSVTFPFSEAAARLIAG